MFILDIETINDITEGFHIPPQPKALQQFQLLQEQGQRDLIAAAKIVEQDVEIAGLVLKTINSPLFGLKRKVSDIRQVVITLGFDTVYLVVTSCQIRNAFSGNACISLDRFWDESLENAVLCQRICEWVGSQVEAAMAYITGLFHDCGIAAMAIRYSDYTDVLTKANKSTDVALDEFEKKHYEYNHVEVGATIAQSWHITEEVCEVIANHHNVEYLTTCENNICRELWSILRIATNVMSRRRQGHAEEGWNEISQDVCASLGLDKDQYQELIEDLECSEA